MVGAAPTGDAPNTSEWSTILLPIKVPLILEIWRYLNQIGDIIAQRSCICIQLIYTSIFPRGPFYSHGLTLIPAWINNHTHHRVWVKLLACFQTPIFNSCTFECRHRETYRSSDICWLKKWVGPVRLLCVIMFNISKIRPKSFLGPVKAKQFSLCLWLELISNFTPHFIMDMTIYPCWD